MVWAPTGVQLLSQIQGVVVYLRFDWTVYLVHNA